jgi:hypothetical protein
MLLPGAVPVPMERAQELLECGKATAAASDCSGRQYVLWACLAHVHNLGGNSECVPQVVSGNCHAESIT